MKTTIALLGVLAALKDDLVLVELTFFDGDVNLDNVLPDDAAGTNVKVAKYIDSLSQRIRGEVRHTQLQSCP